MRHTRTGYYIAGEGTVGDGLRGRHWTKEPLRAFRFSRMGPKGSSVDRAVLEKVAKAMTAQVRPAPEDARPDVPPVPAGYTYLSQFVGHDLTMDRTGGRLDEQVSLRDLVQGRSPALDLDSVYGRGPDDADDDRFYAPDRVRFKVGITAAITGAGTDVNLNGYDLPRVTHGETKAERQAPLIADPRNDQNLLLAQTHLAFLHFHNRVVDQLIHDGLRGPALFRAARETVVRHYQWVVLTDVLPRVVQPSILRDVFTHGRRFFEVGETDTPTLPIEFAVAAYRFGHSMIRRSYDWNRVFDGERGTLPLMFVFTGLSGNFDPAAADVNDQESGLFERLPTNWAVDWRRLYDFAGENGRPDLAAPAGVNLARPVSTVLVDPLDMLPEGAFGGAGTDPEKIELNQAFRDLARAATMDLADGQQMAELLGVRPLSPEQILAGRHGAVLDDLTSSERTAFAENTPLWFYLLREAELAGGRLDGVGGRIVAEVFHRVLEASRTSIVRDRSWRPTLGPSRDTFRMTDLLLFAFQGRADLLAPLGDSAPL
ncbi:peroxidase family protein [Paractinoplanes brasiliensis]|uniref:Heme peroxidase n=1 Tax=Paractinoplanes brasiliensis TaxID=52695 RepID=A0A4R6JL86_9ACTN|nr:heme peroxidase family protein [Actinoplanes brasiliensis]TDO37060.1 heme peroxidase [Actinoplanes brasiliensis]GID32246.1 myeloperoxidase [Actinoplanes brasiliensis]